nr:N-acetylglucosamine-specific PTS transporter subunit IIBC [Candidatus Fukatsuia symbiotica]
MLSYLQKVGKALMVPVATLPAAAILMGIGYWIDPIGWGGDNKLAALLIKSGSAIIGNMSALFAIGVAYGMSKDKDGAAALTGFVGYLVLTTLCSPDVISILQQLPRDQVPAAFEQIHSQFIGIMVGIMSAELYNRFSSVELPKALSFFSGRRLIPILTSFLMIFVAFILMYLWPIIYNALVTFGEYIKGMGSFGAGLYAFFNRLLIPVGMHHALNSVFWFNVAGINDIPNFLAGQQAIDSGKAIVGITGRYQAGFFPIMMFGLPGAALAIYHCARPENKSKVAGIMLAGAFAAFFTGISEPLEFSFMFVAPILYFIHAVLTGISVYIAANMHWIAGFGFSAGLVDMILSSHNPLSTHWYMLIPQGLVFFVIYYLLFRFTINKFSLLTPGREDQVSGNEEDGYDIDRNNTNNENAIKLLARRYISAVGGSDNVVAVDACITRLRLNVKDASRVNDALARHLGASGVIRLNKYNVQIIVVSRAELIANAMQAVLALSSISPAALTASPGHIEAQKGIKKPQSTPLILLSPITGDVCAWDQVADPTYASGSIGDGVAIYPTGKTVVAPANGKISWRFNTNHAFCLTTATGAEILVHIGSNIEKQYSHGFKRLVEEEATVVAGQPVLTLDLAYLETSGVSLLSSILIQNITDFGSIAVLASGFVVAGQTDLLAIGEK